MTSEDLFFRDLEKAQRLTKTIQGDVRERETFLRNQQSTARIDGTLRGQLKQLNLEIEGLLRHIDSYEKNINSFSITQKEIDRRRKMALDVQNTYRDLEKKAQMTSYNLQQQGNPFNQEQKKFVEVHDTSNMSNEQMMQIQNKMIKDQDEQIDIMTNTMKNIKNIGTNIRDETKLQNKLLNDLDNETDKNQRQMNRANVKLVDLMKQSSNCKLYVIIAIELAILVLLVLW
mmetsp:Transcript_27171/g.31339  ORF Transcript_27171/g.31339 Transcript_27171/m.31339 type:complete len:230 (+) Transcript_27171:12-701(+)